MSQNRGVIFYEHYSNWQQIMEKAKQENKAVFVDFYASWSGPCKWMDSNVYSNFVVGDLMNQRFVAVKIEIDTTEPDSPIIRQSSLLARMMADKYRINAYPSYVFFFSDGRAIHKDVGGKDVTDFLTMIKMVQDSNFQYYTLLDKYCNGSLVYRDLPKLARMARRLGEDSLAEVVAKDYLLNELVSKHQKGVWRGDDLIFIREFCTLVHLRDPVFNLYFSERKSIDSILGGLGKSDGLLNAIVYHDEVLTEVKEGVKDNREPKWRRIRRRISRSYGRKFVESNLLKGRIEYYQLCKEWGNYARYFVKQVEAASIEKLPASFMTSFVLNNDAFEVFQYSSNKRELEKALRWVDRSLTFNAQYPEALDTKANLLYKLGQKDEGLILEKRSYKLAPNNKDIEANYTKMKSGLPTW